jgi:pimeloyl-ACP methyl ester carboxylesterase
MPARSSRCGRSSKIGSGIGRRRRLSALVAAQVLVAAIVWWPLVLGPLARGGIVVLDVYSSALSGDNAAGLITPAPRVSDETVALDGEGTRVTWWVPGLGDRHPGMLVVNGASQLGNDDPETRRISEALARAGYLVMLPEFSFLKDGRLERAAPARVDAAFAALLRRPDVDPDRVGAFGFSVGGGIMLAAAEMTGASLGRARYLGALGAFFDIPTYLASVVTGVQVRGGRPEPWVPDAEARLRLPVGAAQAIADPRDRERVVAAIRASGGRLEPDAPADLGDEARALWSVLAATDYERAVAGFQRLSPGLRDTFAALSPSTRWEALRVPVYWLHDEGDRFEPVSEAERALAAPRPGSTHLQLTRLLSHAAALGPGARQQGVDFWVRELSGLLGFAMDVLRRAG